ncbi:MAG TPA: NUDIX hydrolase [Hyphomicrobiaceae bacterium]|nr:NUDIX hydrolase [Hyphomicrobiaceae bacterium]
MKAPDPEKRCTEFTVTVADRILLLADKPIPTQLLPPPQSADTHWQRRVRETPALFNGTVFVMTPPTSLHATSSGVQFDGQLHPVEFRTFLYWREVAWQAGVIDAFGSAILLSAEGHIILGTAGPETINSGSAYFFGGFLDPRDIDPDGIADIAGSTARELQEETGLVVGFDVDPAPGFVIASSARQVSFGVVYRARERTDALIGRIHRHLRDENDLEITALKIVRSHEDASDPSIQPFTRAVIGHLFG